MRNWWKKFWKLRKQNDVIKVMLLFLAIGTAFLVNAIYNGALLCQMAQSHAEYILSGGANGSVTNAELEEIRKLEDVTALSRQMDVPVTLKYQGNETAFTCAVLTEDYIEKAYGIKESGSTKTFYVNQSAYEQFKQNLHNAQSLEHDFAYNSLQVSYCMDTQPMPDMDSQDGKKDTGADTAPLWRTAKLVLIENDAHSLPYICCCGSIWPDDAASVRVYCQTANHETVRRLQELGFTIENMEEIQEAEYTQNIKADRIRHSITAALLCLACMSALWKYGYAHSSTFNAGAMNT